jgi:CBS-domain-containing membrane protein
MRLLNILKENNIIKASPDDHLSNVLSKLSTSHDAAFIFSEDKFLGVISPYYTVIKASHPGNTKVIHCLSHPPKIYLNFPLVKVCNAFIQSRIHYLPVFDEKEKFSGIISARRVLSHLKDLPIFKIKIENFIEDKSRPIVAIYEDDSIAKAVALFKSTKLSKLIVINRDMKLRGIISYYDLIAYVMTPKKSPGRGERTGKEVHYLNHGIKNFIKTSVLTVKKELFLFEAIQLILDKKIGSVIIIDEERHPISVITTKDIFNHYINSEKRFFNIIRPIRNIFRRKKY